MKNKEKLNILFASKENIDNYVKFFEKAYEVNVIPFESYKNIERSKIDLVVFIGDSHIHPKNYEDELGPTTKADEKIDDEEYNTYYRFNASTPKIGIGRGAHLITTCAGGKIIQNITGHNDVEHLVNMYQYGIHKIKSNHDQMMYPFNLKEDDYKLLGFTKHFQSTKYLNGKDQEFKLSNLFLEPEIVQYPKLNSLCFQLDPVDNESVDEISLLLIDMLLKKKFKKEVVQIHEEIDENPRTQFGIRANTTRGNNLGLSGKYTGGVITKFDTVNMDYANMYYANMYYDTGSFKEKDSTIKSTANSLARQSDMHSEAYSKFLEQAARQYTSSNDLKTKSELRNWWGGDSTDNLEL